MFLTLFVNFEGDKDKETIVFICEHNAAHIIATAYKHGLIKRQYITKSIEFDTICVSVRNPKQYKILEGCQYYLSFDYSNGQPSIKTKYEFDEYVPMEHRPNIKPINRLTWLDLAIRNEPAIYDDFYIDPEEKKQLAVKQPIAMQPIAMQPIAMQLTSNHAKKQMYDDDYLDDSHYYANDNIDDNPDDNIDDNPDDNVDYNPYNVINIGKKDDL